MAEYDSVDAEKLIAEYTLEDFDQLTAKPNIVLYFVKRNTNEQDAISQK